MANLQSLRWTYWDSNYDMLCTNWSQPNDFSDSGYAMVWGGVFYMVLKVADLMDTVGQRY